jgi:hypothetical protein
MSDTQAEFHALYRKLRIRDQLQFYEDRREEYRAAHRQTVLIRNFLLVLSAVAGVGGQFADAMTRGGLAIAAAVLGGLAVAITGFESLIGFPQLSEVYADAAINLERAEIDWDAADPHADLGPHLSLVEGIFISESGQWGQLITGMATRNAEQTPGEPTDEVQP